MQVKEIKMAITMIVERNIRVSYEFQQRNFGAQRAVIGVV